MSGADSESTNFVEGGNVRQNAQDFNPGLYSNEGPVKGYPGPNTGIAAAAGNPGPEIVPKTQSDDHKTQSGGNSRDPKPGPDYHGFVDSNDLQQGVFAHNYAPVQSCNNNQCGGKRRGTKRHMRKSKHHTRKSVRKSKHHTRKSVRKSKHHTRKSKHHIRKSVRKFKHHIRKSKHHIRKSVRKSKHHMRRHMRGGSPAEVPAGSQSSGYHQYMSNQPFTNSYAAGGKLAPADNALANPVLITPTNNCDAK